MTIPPRPDWANTYDELLLEWMLAADLRPRDRVRFTLAAWPRELLYHVGEGQWACAIIKEYDSGVTVDFALETIDPTRYVVVDTSGRGHGLKAGEREQVARLLQAAGLPLEPFELWKASEVIDTTILIDTLRFQEIESTRTSDFSATIRLATASTLPPNQRLHELVAPAVCEGLQGHLFFPGVLQGLTVQRVVDTETRRALAPLPVTGVVEIMYARSNPAVAPTPEVPPPPLAERLGAGHQPRPVSARKSAPELQAKVLTDDWVYITEIHRTPTRHGTYCVTFITETYKITGFLSDMEYLLSLGYPLGDIANPHHVWSKVELDDPILVLPGRDKQRRWRIGKVDWSPEKAETR